MKPLLIAKTFHMRESQREFNLDCVAFLKSVDDNNSFSPDGRVYPFSNNMFSFHIMLDRTFTERCNTIEVMEGSGVVPLLKIR
jgi:hypothetical protein